MPESTASCEIARECIFNREETVIRRLFVVCLAVLAAGCATYAPSVPTGYAGPRAQLDDSSSAYTGSKADFFIAEQIDGANIDNSLDETGRRNAGSGMRMTPYAFQRELVAEKPVKVAIRGRTRYAAPIQALMGTVYQVKGVVEFTPKANGRYVVRGELGEGYSAVWIEDAETRLPVAEKVEVKGSAKLGILEK